MGADIIIKNGRVIDPVSGIDKITDIFIGGGKILALGEYSPEQESRGPGEFKPICEEIDATGCIVTPGLFDAHMHLFHKGGFGSVPGDVAMFPGGVTTGTDAGSAGVLTYRLFSQQARRCLSTVKAMLCVVPVGIAMTHYTPECMDPKYFDIQAMKDCIAEHPGEIVAVKLRINRKAVGDWGTKPLEAAVRIGDELGLPLMVHPSDPFDEQEVIFDILRPGDVYAHTYTKSGRNIIGENGWVKPAFHKAREKGIIFDLGHGYGQFNLEVFRRAQAEGFLPDIISTDMSPMSMNRTPTYSLVNVMSKLMNMGVSLQEVLRAVTAAPAKVYGLTGQVGCLRVGGAADVAIFRLKDDKIRRFTDSTGDSVEGNLLLAPQMTVKNGVIVYRNAEFF